MMTDTLIRIGIAICIVVVISKDYIEKKKNERIKQ